MTAVSPSGLPAPSTEPPAVTSRRALGAPTQGLYDPAFEHDACGVAFVATLTGIPTHAIIEQGLEALHNLDHRGATGIDVRTGDGAGILMQVPDAFLRAVADLERPLQGAYAVGLAFLPTDPEEAAATAEAAGSGPPGERGPSTSRPDAT